MGACARREVGLLLRLMLLLLLLLHWLRLRRMGFLWGRLLLHGGLLLLLLRLQGSLLLLHWRNGLGRLRMHWWRNPLLRLKLFLLLLVEIRTSVLHVRKGRHGRPQALRHLASKLAPVGIPPWTAPWV